MGWFGERSCCDVMTDEDFLNEMMSRINSLLWLGAGSN